MNLQTIFSSKFFDSRYKLAAHISQVILVVLAMGFSVPRLFMKDQPRTRANTIALGMGAKSLIIIAYQLCTEHIRACQKWRSYKAYTVLNGLEIVFWGAVIFLVLQANLKMCVNLGCYLSWVVLALSIVMDQFCIYMFLVTFREYRYHRQQILEFKTTRSSQSQELHASNYAKPSKATSPRPSDI